MPTGLIPTPSIYNVVYCTFKISAIQHINIPAFSTLKPFSISRFIIFQHFNYEGPKSVPLTIAMSVVAIAAVVVAVEIIVVYHDPQ